MYIRNGKALKDVRTNGKFILNYHFGFSLSLCWIIFVHCVYIFLACVFVVCASGMLLLLLGAAVAIAITVSSIQLSLFSRTHAHTFRVPHSSMNHKYCCWIQCTGSFRLCQCVHVRTTKIVFTDALC